jgi:hypothetical protein
MVEFYLKPYASPFVIQLAKLSRQRDESMMTERHTGTYSLKPQKEGTIVLFDRLRLTKIA